MAQILVRNVSEDVKVRLKRRAEARGVSLEAEVREILDKAANEPARPVEPVVEGAGTKFAREIAKFPIDEETWQEFQKNLAEVGSATMRDVDFGE